MAKKPANDTDQTLTGVEIFKAGSYQVTDREGNVQTFTYSPSDVKQLAENGNALLTQHNFEPPAKLGHDDNQRVAAEAGLPAAGWVSKLYSKAGKLYADFKQVPAKLAEAIKRGRYKYVSSEIYDPEDTERNFGEFGIQGFTLRAVAFLGADVPVVKGMKPLMLAAGAADNVRIITIPVEDNTMKMFAEKNKQEQEPDGDEPEMMGDKGGPMMVPANRHPYGALVKAAEGGDDAPVEQVHAQHPDGSYDVHDLHKPENVRKAVPHKSLTLLSEADYKRVFTPTAVAPVHFAEGSKQAAMSAQALLAARTENLRLRNERRDEKIAAFAEKHKVYGLTAALKPAFEAIAKTEITSPVKLAEGKELPFLDAFFEFAEGLIGAKKVELGEAAPAAGEGDPNKTNEVKLAEAPFEEYSKQMKVEISNGDLAVKARKYAEENKTTYREALLAVAATTTEEK